VTLQVHLARRLPPKSHYYAHTPPKLQRHWAFTLPRFPLEKQKFEISVAVMALALGWKPRQFTALVQTLLPPNLQGHTWLMLLHCLEHDTRGCHTQKDALHSICKGMVKYASFRGNLSSILSYMSHMMKTEIFPELNTRQGPGCDQIDNLRKGYRLAQCVTHLIVYLPQVQREQPEDQRLALRMPDLRSHQFHRCDSPGQEFLVLIRKFLTKNVKRQAEQELGQRIEAGLPIHPQTLFHPKSFDLISCVRTG